MAVRKSPQTDATREKVHALFENVTRVIRGKDEVVELAVVSLLAGGHLLLEDIPGVGKTTLALAVARSVNSSFKRIQFTNDTIPADILGAMVYSRKEESFRFVKGPIFAGVVLADEINRTSPKTQSALLEAMTEKRVSVENQSHELPDPFLVIATQNPMEHHGTFPLPENQLDRFLLRTHIGYPDIRTEMEILTRDLHPDSAKDLQPVVNTDEIREARHAVRAIHLEEKILHYLLELVAATRSSDKLTLGASPRGSLMLKHATQALAYFRGRDYVLPDDIKHLFLPVLAHRMVSRETGLHGETDRRETENILQDILNQTPVPI